MISQQQVEEWVKSEEDEFNIKDFRLKYELPSDDSGLYVVFNRLCDKKIIKRLSRGWYRKVKQVEPLKVKGVITDDYFNLKHPRSYKDDSSFGFEELFDVSQGDLIIIGGQSNAGKTMLAHNYLSENVENHYCVLMGNEYKSNDGFLLPKYLRRFKKLEREDVELIDKEGNLNFELLPVDCNYEDYIKKDKLNIIDWLGLDKDWFMMGNILKEIKKGVGKGIAIVCLQKKANVNYAYGAEMTEHFADIYMTVDLMGKFESRLTLGKIKEPKSREHLLGRMWGFETNDGSNLINIREMVKCYKCHGKGYTNFGKCDVCLEKGFVNKGNDLL